MAEFFISYSRVDKPFTVGFKARLQTMFGDDSVWYDGNLAGGNLWWETILKQIAQCEIFIYLLSNESVQSSYCQAEFNEAIRLQKHIITVQVRDRTRLSGKLSDIHYVDMKAGVDDASAQAELVKAINAQLSEKVESKEPLWETPTPKPEVTEDIIRQPQATDIQTPPLRLPEQANTALRGKLIRRLGIAVIAITVVSVVAAFIISTLRSPARDASATPAETATTQVAVAGTTTAEVAASVAPSETDTATATSSSTPSVAPNPTASFTLDIVEVVGTADAQTATAQARENAVARATGFVLTAQHATETQDAATAIAQQDANLTATATLWTPTPTATFTPTPTPTPTDTPTDTRTPTSTRRPTGTGLSPSLVPSTFTPTPSGPIITPFNGYGVNQNPNVTINVREEPNNFANILTSLPCGEVITLDQRTTNDGDTWYHSSTLNGWVSGSVIAVYSSHAEAQNAATANCVAPLPSLTPTSPLPSITITSPSNGALVNQTQDVFFTITNDTGTYHPVLYVQTNGVSFIYDFAIALGGGNYVVGDVNFFPDLPCGQRQFTIQVVLEGDPSLTSTSVTVTSCPSSTPAPSTPYVTISVVSIGSYYDEALGCPATILVEVSGSPATGNIHVWNASVGPEGDFYYPTTTFPVGESTYIVGLGGNQPEYYAHEVWFEYNSVESNHLTGLTCANLPTFTPNSVELLATIDVETATAEAVLTAEARLIALTRAAQYAAATQQVAATAQYFIDLTATATLWTAMPTPRPTITPTFTPTDTPSPTTSIAPTEEVTESATEEMTEEATESATEAVTVEVTETSTPTLISTEVANVPFVIRNSSGAELGNGTVRVYYEDSVQYPQTMRIELELYFNNKYITETPFGPRTAIPVMTDTPPAGTTLTPPISRPSPTPRIPHYEGAPALLEIYELMGASLICLPTSFTGCAEEIDIQEARRITLAGMEWSWIISPQEGIEGRQNLELQIWRLISLNEVEHAEILWNHDFTIDVQPTEKPLWERIVTFGPILVALIAGISGIAVAIINWWKNKSENNKQQAEKTSTVQEVPRVFISYRRSVSGGYGQLIRDRLKERGAIVFLDVEDIHEGAFESYIKESIEKCDYFVVILSPGTLESEWVVKEIQYAFECKRVVIPLLINEFDLYGAEVSDELKILQAQNAIKILDEFLDAAMDKLAEFIGLTRK